MRNALLVLILTAGLAVLSACNPWGANNPPRSGTNPELQMLRDARMNGLRTRCIDCHGARADILGPAGSLVTE